jgi:hypothetical protein
MHAVVISATSSQTHPHEACLAYIVNEDMAKHTHIQQQKLALLYLTGT